MTEELNDALDLLERTASRRGGPDAARDLLDERVAGRFIAGPDGDISWTAQPLDLRLTESRISSSRVVYLRYQRMR